LNDEETDETDGAIAVSKWPFKTKEEVQAAANAVAAILDSMHFTAMAADCRGERLQGDLRRYAQVALKNVSRDRPDLASQVQTRLRAIGLV
jgi:hypothetical protein